MLVYKTSAIRDLSLILFGTSDYSQKIGVQLRRVPEISMSLLYALDE